MGKKLLFVHGAGSKGDLWTRQRGVFPRSLTPNLPGHPLGKGRRRIEDYVSWLNEFRLKEDLEEVYLVGHSMGGAIALMYVLFFPYVVKKLILLGTGASLPVSPKILTGLERDYGTTVFLIMEYAFSKGTDPRLKAKSIEEMKGISPEVTLGDFLACKGYSVEERLGDIKIPTLILVGEEDKMTPVHLSQRLAYGIEGSKLEVIPQAGHMVMLEKYREVNHSIRNFIGEGESP